MPYSCAVTASRNYISINNKSEINDSGFIHEASSTRSAERHYAFKAFFLANNVTLVPSKATHPNEKVSKFFCHIICISKRNFCGLLTLV